MENGEGMSGERSFDINDEEDTESTGETDARPFGGEEPLEETGPGVSMGGEIGEENSGNVLLSHSPSKASTSSEKNKRKAPNKRKKGWDRTRRGRKSKSPVPPVANNLSHPNHDGANLREDVVSPSAVFQDIQDYAAASRPKKRRSALQKVNRTNVGLQSVRLKLTDTNFALKAELDHVKRGKKKIMDKHAQDLKVKDEQMKSELEVVRSEQKKAAEEHARDLFAKDTQIAAIRELHAKEIAVLKRQVLAAAETSQSQRKASNMVFV